MVVVTKLNRLGHSVADLTNIAKRLKADGAGLVILDQSIDTATAAGKMVLHIIAAIAEFELAGRWSFANKS